MASIDDHCQTTLRSDVLEAFLLMLPGLGQYKVCTQPDYQDVRFPAALVLTYCQTIGYLYATAMVAVIYETLLK